jgi:hypothetical protein
VRAVDVLAANRFFQLTIDRDRKLVRWMRTPMPYSMVEQFDDVARASVLGLLTVDRGTHALLIDLREGPMRNDPAFEEAALRFRRDIHRGFARSAVLVRSRAGLLQISRHLSERPLDVKEHPTFLDEEEALAYLAG